jgi:uncharacterized membrane protein
MSLARREFLLQTSVAAAAVATGCRALCAGQSKAVQAAQSALSLLAGEPRPQATIVLLNGRSLRQKYPDDADQLLEAVEGFARQNQAEVLNVGSGNSASAIKRQLMRHPRRPRRLLIVGPEEAIPRFSVRTPELELDTDYFYGDLDGDGLAEVSTARLLGSPQTMRRLLGESPLPPISAPRALCFTPIDPRQLLEMNRFAATLGELGCAATFRDAADQRALGQADVIVHMGHGDPGGWYGMPNQSLVTANSLPPLPRQPVVFSNGCSTAAVGSTIVRAYLDQGCRAYVGSASIAHGMSPAQYGNELTMHLIDAVQAHPDWSLAELVAAARSRYIEVNQLGETLRRLEAGENLAVDVARVSTALQVHVFGDVRASYPRSRPRPCFSQRPLVSAPTLLPPGGSLDISYEIGPADGLPAVFFHADWDADVSAGLELTVVQNGNVVRRVDWTQERDLSVMPDSSWGGYREAGRYHAYALLPLMRQAGSNEVRLTLKRSLRPVLIHADSALEIWPKRNPPHPLGQAVRRKPINLLVLSQEQDLDYLRRALDAMDDLQYECRQDLGDRLDRFEFADDPDQVFDFDRYDVILIDEVPQGYRMFHPGMAAKVRDFVRRGGGLLMFGGWWTFAGLHGGGGYGGTPIEQALPVQILGPDDTVARRTSVLATNFEHPITAGLDWSNVPQVAGYNRAATKPAAAVLAQTETGDPLLAAWQYGRGRSAAWLTAFARGWSLSLTRWPSYNRFWQNLVRWASGHAAT